MKFPASPSSKRSVLQKRSSPNNCRASWLPVFRSIKTYALAGILVVCVFSNHAKAAVVVWQNSGTDFNTNSNWTGTIAGNLGRFDNGVIAQPNVSSSLSIVGLFFSDTGVTGYDITGAANQKLTLTATDTTSTVGSSTSNSNSAAIFSRATGTNTIDVPIVLGAASGSQTFGQVSGGTLIVNGAVSSTNTVGVSLRGGGTIQLNGNNIFTGGTSVDTSGEVVVLGNDNAPGTGTFSINSSATIQAGGGARSIANAVILAANTTISGSNDIDFTGSVTSSGSSTRTLTIDNSGSTSISGNVLLAPDNTTARGLIITGGSPITISGVIANNNSGNTLASPLTYSGSSTLTLKGNNTYSGTTAVTSGTLLANSTVGSATGSGAVTVSNGATLGGTGKINAGSNNVTIGTGANSGGSAIITGGTNGTVGSLTLTAHSLLFSGATNNLSTYLVDLTATSSDMLSVIGNLDLNSLSDQIRFQGISGASSYQLVTFTGTLSGTFNTVTGLPSGYSLVYNPGEIDLVMTPEPSTWFAAVLALSGIVYSQRKRFRVH